jgi:hypothetical protein
VLSSKASNDGHLLATLLGNCPRLRVSKTLTLHAAITMPKTTMPPDTPIPTYSNVCA